MRGFARMAVFPLPALLGLHRILANVRLRASLGRPRMAGKGRGGRREAELNVRFLDGPADRPMAEPGRQQPLAQVGTAGRHGWKADLRRDHLERLPVTRSGHFPMGESTKIDFSL
jgi:hypothetical protein